MTALNSSRKSDKMGPESEVFPSLISYTVAAGAQIWRGAMVGINSAGFAVQVTSNSALYVVGRAEDLLDNASGGNGPLFIRVRTGVFNYVSGTGPDALTVANIGQPVYASDDQTVNLTSASGTRPLAGFLVNMIPSVASGTLVPQVALGMVSTAMVASLLSGGGGSSGAYTSVTTFANGETKALGAGRNALAVCNPGAGNTCTPLFPPAPADGEICTIALDGLGTALVTGNGHDVESCTSAGSYGPTSSMSTDNAPKTPTGAVQSWIYILALTRWKAA